MSFLPKIEALLTPSLRADLCALAQGAVPLQRWVAQKAYNPQTDPTFEGQPMPWRTPGRALTPADTGFESFFEGLLRETSDDIQALARWQRVAAAPLAASPLDDVAAWRTERGLQEFASFGIVPSQNVLLDSQNLAIARLPFYLDTLGDLAYCLALSRPTDEAGWEALAKQLFTDTLAAWPGSQYPASVFMYQFVADVLYALLGMRNQSAVPGHPSYATAVLTELGQARRRGNKNTPEQALDAVARFVTQIEKDLHAASTPATDTQRAAS
ncbi:MAG: hypothetical protein PW845_21075 [Pseudomonas sp.]|nr:hypothetical protein [Pseudomonas sp.]